MTLVRGPVSSARVQPGCSGPAGEQGLCLSVTPTQLRTTVTWPSPFACVRAGQLAARSPEETWNSSPYLPKTGLVGSHPNVPEICGRRKRFKEALEMQSVEDINQ